MTADEFARIDELFHAALELSEPERTRYLDCECNADPALRAQVEALLAVQTDAEFGIAAAVSQAIGHLDRHSQAGDCGAQFGRYRLLNEIGQGGMATVYKAVRIDGEFAQNVAIKVIRRGLDTGSVLRRFRSERQILATLTHPNIAVLLDGGSTPDGRPYLVMELIEGRTITQFADDAQLSVRERIELFRRVCSAVSYAHERQIIHRDIKPGNVLVTKDGVAKLLDFGIAKLLQPDTGAASDETETHLRMMTPDYASPEQIRGDALTSATDIYSLGILLYELLTGGRPFSSKGRSSGEIDRAVLEDTALRASRMVADTRLRQQLEGDLDTILAMTLRKETSRRYSSVQALDEDLGRYLEGRGVLARRETVGYRAGKWLRRHRWSAAFACSSCIAILAVVVTGSYLRKAEAERRATILVERGGRLMNDPRSSKEDLRPLRESIATFREATVIAPTFGPAWLGLAEAAEFSIDFDRSEAAVLARTARAAANRVLELEPGRAKAWEILAVLAAREGRSAEAVSAYSRAVDLNPVAPYAVRGYSTSLMREGKFDEAFRVLDRAIAGLPDPANLDPQAVTTRGKVILLAHKGMLLNTVDRFEEARIAAQQASDLDGTYRLAYWVAGLANENLGRLADAERDFRTAVRLGPQDARMISSLAHVLAHLGRNEEALALESRLHRMHAGGRQVVACELAIVRAGWRDQRGALTWLEQLSSEADRNVCLTDKRLRALHAAQGYR